MWETIKSKVTAILKIIWLSKQSHTMFGQGLLELFVLVTFIALQDKDKYCERVTANLKIAKPSNQHHRVFGQGLFPFAEAYLVLAKVIILEQK